MHPKHVTLILILAGVSAAFGQQGPAVNPANAVPRADLSLGYNYLGANAPPGKSNYFGLQGGYVSGSYRLTNLFSIAGEFTGGHASHISTLGQDLTLFTFMGGPRVSFPGHRLVPYGQALFGGAHGGDSYFPSSSGSKTSASSWALSAGGGFDYNLSHRFAIRLIEAQYVRTALPNGANDAQNNFMIGAGIVFKFGVPDYVPPPPAAPMIHNEISFTCSTNVASIEQGQVLEIVGNTLTKPDSLEVNYNWSSDRGAIDGSGRRVTLNTVGLTPGNYFITGHASLASNPDVKSDCQVGFRVLAATQVATGNSNTSKEEEAFHTNVPDALFDYDSSDIRSDAKEAILHAAEYLNAHPSIGVLVAGYADERGSAEYNLALGEKRASAARDALIAAGVSPDRVEIISYGKEAQVCTANNEACYQQNRRAAFEMRH